jgi:hypothetical protein
MQPRLRKRSTPDLIDRNKALPNGSKGTKMTA